MSEVFLCETYYYKSGGTRNDGFTLLEALVAVAILAWGAAAILGYVQQISDYSERTQVHQRLISGILNDVALAHCLVSTDVSLQAFYDHIDVSANENNAHSNKLTMMIRNMPVYGIDVPISLGLGPYQIISLNGGKINEAHILVKGTVNSLWRAH